MNRVIALRGFPGIEEQRVMLSPAVLPSLLALTNWHGSNCNQSIVSRGRQSVEG